MKKSLRTVMIAICLLIASNNAQAGKTFAFVEVMTEPKTALKSLTFDAVISHSFTKQWSISAFLLVKGGWAEARVGGWYKPASWIGFCLEAGISQGTSEGMPKARFAAKLFAETKLVNFFGVVEFDHDVFYEEASKPWFDLELAVHPLKWLSAGLRYRRWVGIGPVIKFKFWRMCVWACWNPLDPDKKEVFDPLSAMAGVKLFM